MYCAQSEELIEEANLLIWCECQPLIQLIPKLALSTFSSKGPTMLPKIFVYLLNTHNHGNKFAPKMIESPCLWQLLGIMAYPNLIHLGVQRENAPTVCISMHLCAIGIP